MRHEIHVAPFRDRVLHHALCSVLVPIITRGFIADTCACIRGRGTHRTVVVPRVRLRSAREAVTGQRFDLILLAYRLPGVDGLRLLRQLLADAQDLPVVMVTGNGDHRVAVLALKSGASDYVVKREGYLTRLPSTIENALAQRALAEEKETLLILNGIARVAASTLNLDEILWRVAFAAYAAVGIENARMYEGLEQAALWIEATVEEHGRELQATNARLQEVIHESE